MVSLVRKKIFFLITLIFVLTYTFGASETALSARGEGVIQGTVVDSKNKPIPSLKLYLIHHKLGRSFPVATNRLGKFVFSDLPVNKTYYLEIYWGKKLVYRKRCPELKTTLILPKIKL